MSSDLLAVVSEVILTFLSARILLCVVGGDVDPEDERVEEPLSEEELPRLREDPGP